MCKAVPLQWLFPSDSIYIIFHNPFHSPDSHFQKLHGKAQSWTNIQITALSVLLLFCSFPSASSSHSWRTKNGEAWADGEQELRRGREGNAVVDREHLAAETCQRASSNDLGVVLPLSWRLAAAVNQVLPMLWVGEHCFPALLYPAASGVDL